MDLEEKAVACLKEKGYTITTAESCTGGMLASRLINVPGISDIYGEGYITYSNDAKEHLLGVSADALRQFGAVSAVVAKQMACGAARAAHADVALAVTGIAGPDGGTEEKPVGLVYIGCYVKGKTVVTENHFEGSRLEIRQATTQSALELLVECLCVREVQI